MSVPLAGAALLIGLYVYYDLVVYRDHLLRGDEPAFVSATLESPVSWFTRGYLDYFNLYPEWGTQHTSPLLKPVTNAVGYLNYSLFGRSYALHFAAFFLMQFIGLLVIVRLLRELAVPPLPTAVMALLFLFNPAFMNTGLIMLPFHFDVLAGVFAMAAFLALWRERYGWALLLLTLAVFTKESAVFAPLAAALSLMIWCRPPSKSALMMLPLVLWVAARFLAYGDVLAGGITSPTGEIATGLSMWPTGLVPAGFVRQLGSSLPSSRTEVLNLVFLLANIGVWVFLGYAAWATARRPVAAPASAELTAALLVWTLGALSFGVLAGYHTRYGGSIYPFVYLLLAVLLFSPGYRVPRWAAASVLLVFAAATAVQGVRSVRLALAWQSVIAPERALHDALKMLPQDGRTVYVVNAPPLLVSAPHHLTFAWSLNLDVVIVSQFGGCPTSSDTGTTELSGADLVSVRIPDCAWLLFGSVPPDVVRRGTPLRREGVGAYVFPDRIAASSDYPLELGRTLTFQIDPKKADLTLIGYNWASGSYSVISGR